MRTQSIVSSIYLVLISFLFISCDYSSPIEASTKLSDTITIGINEVYQHKQPNFSLQIDSILSDSRCPYGAECFWAGNAEVRMKLVVDNSYPILFKFNTLQTYGQEVQLNGLEYKLIDVSPHPDILIKFGYQNYRVKIHYSTIYQ